MEMKIEGRFSSLRVSAGGGFAQLVDAAGAPVSVSVRAGEAQRMITLRDGSVLWMIVEGDQIMDAVIGKWDRPVVDPTIRTMKVVLDRDQM